MQKNILLFFFVASTLTGLILSQNFDDDEDFIPTLFSCDALPYEYCMYPQTATFDTLTYKATAGYGFNTYFLNQDQYNCLNNYDSYCVSGEDDDDGFEINSSSCINVINGASSIPAISACSGLSEMYDSSASCQGLSTCMKTASVSAGSTYYVVVENTAASENTIHVSWYQNLIGLAGFALFSAIFFPIVCCCGIAGLTFVVVYNKKGNPKNKRKANTTIVQLQKSPGQVQMAPQQGLAQVQMGQQPVYMQQQGQAQMQMGQQPVYMQQQGQAQMQMGQQPVYMQQQGQAQMQMGQQPVYIQESVANQGAVQPQIVYK